MSLKLTRRVKEWVKTTSLAERCCVAVWKSMSHTSFNKKLSWACLTKRLSTKRCLMSLTTHDTVTESSCMIRNMIKND